MTVWAANPLALHPSASARLGDDERTGSKSSAGRSVLIAFCFTAVLAIRFSDLFRPFPGDGAMFIAMGKIVSQGGGIGREITDNKFPTVGLLTSGGWNLAGANWPMWVAMLTAMGLAGPILLARSAARNLGQYAALPTLLLGLIDLNFSYGVDGFHLEAAQVFFTAIAASAALSVLTADDARDSFLVGLAAGVAAMLKPSGLAVLGAFALVIVLCNLRRPRRIAVHAAAVLGGVAIPAAVTLIYLSGANLLAELPIISRQIARYASQSHWEASSWVRWGIVIVIFGSPTLVRGFIFRRDRIPNRLNMAVLCFALLWITMEAVGIAAQGRMYRYHFLAMAPAAVLLFGILPRRDRMLPLASALALPLLISAVGAAMANDNGSSPMQRLKSSEYLSAHAKPGDGVWADGMTRLLIETDLQPGSSYFSTFIWANDDGAPLRGCRAVLNDFEQRQPNYILLPADIDAHVDGFVDGIDELSHNPLRAARYRLAWSQLRNYVLQHYVPEVQIDAQIVYRRIAAPYPKAR